HPFFFSRVLYVWPCIFFLTLPLSPRSTLFPYTTLFRSPLRRVPCPWDHGADRDPNAREPGCRDGPPADERAAAALHLVWWLGAARHDALDRSAVEHLPARPCLSATSRFTSSASGAPGCPASPRSS